MVAYITVAVQHFSNKTGPNILVNVISLNIESIVKDSTSDNSDTIASVVQYTICILHAREHVFYD